MSASMLRRTALYAAHVDAGGRMVDFGGWQMPLHYGSQIEEHHAVRRDAGVFDVSHMRVVDVAGDDSRALLRELLSADIDRRARGQAMYCCMLNEGGGVMDDLIVYRSEAPPVQYRIVLNAATADRDLAWMRQQASRGRRAVELASRDELAILALQGPGAAAALARADPSLAARAALLAHFHSLRAGELFVARTGYTGEDGFEIVVPAGRVLDLWRRLLDAGVPPCGLGARDTLRLEAGMSLYGQDIDETVTPLESGLGWTVELQDARAFVGREPVQRQLQAGPERRLLGLVLLERGVLRAHQPVQTRHGEGLVTSGTFSPTLQMGIGLARLPARVAVGDAVQVQLRGKPSPARVVKPRFVRHGQPLV
jgi:aminomethyltransferase